MGGVAAGISAGAGLIGGAAKFFEGRKMQRDAMKAIENFEWQDLQNPYDTLQVSTMGADLQREEAARTLGTSVDALRAGGTRALVGGLGRVQAQQNLINRQIATDLDQQQKQIDYAGASQDVKIQDMVERRQAEELAGYGQMMNVGMGLKYQGVDNAVNAIGSAASMMSGMGGAGGAGGGITGGMMTGFDTGSIANTLGVRNVRNLSYGDISSQLQGLGLNINDFRYAQRK